MHCGMPPFLWGYKAPTGASDEYTRVAKDTRHSRRTRMAAPIVNKVEMYFLSLFHVGVFNVDVHCLYTLDYIAALNGH